MLISFITKPTIPQWGAKTKVLWTALYSIGICLHLPAQHGPLRAHSLSAPQLPFAPLLHALWDHWVLWNACLPFPCRWQADLVPEVVCFLQSTDKAPVFVLRCQPDKSQSCNVFIPWPFEGWIVCIALAIALAIAPSFIGNKSKCVCFSIVPKWVSVAYWYAYCHAEVVYSPYSQNHKTSQVGRNMQGSSIPTPGTQKSNSMSENFV